NSSDANWQARVDLAAAYRGFEMMNMHEGVCNHLSMMAPGKHGTGRVMLMIPYGLHWSEVTASCLIGVNESGQIIEGEGEIETSAAMIHLGIQSKTDAICAFHLHPPYSTAIGCLKQPSFGMYHQNACRFYDDVAYDNNYSGYATDVKEGCRTGRMLRDKVVLFMCNHGILVVGPDAQQTFDDTYYLERACMNQVLAMQTGQELMEIPEEVCLMNKSLFEKPKYAATHFNSIKRLLAKREPNFMA
ncbi:predicted protein, partial [Nematostella vectensis]